MSVFFKSKLKAFDNFFLSRGYHQADIVSNNDYWKLSDDFRVFKKDRILAIITVDYKDNLIVIDFSLVKNIKNNTIEFFTKKIGSYTYPDKNISLSNYDPVNKSIANTVFLERIRFNSRNEISALIDTQVIFLSENLSDIEDILSL